MKDTIQIQHLDIVFQTRNAPVHALKDVSLTLLPNRITGIIGETGSGKSVMASAILRLLPDYARVTGEIRYQGQNLMELDPRKMRRIRRHHIGLIPQNPAESLNPSRKVLRQASECFDQCRKGNCQTVLHHLLSMGFSNPDQIASMYPYQLSGGMKQRIVSLFGMREQLRWIIADEPTKGLDTIVYQQVFQSLKKLAHSENYSMLVITHDLLLASRLCDDLVVLYEGEIVEKGKASEIISHPRHPYTRGLLRAMPQNGMHSMPAKGETPSEGCPFCGRCSVSTPQCKQIHPLLSTIKENLEVRCLNIDSNERGQ